MRAIAWADMPNKVLERTVITQWPALRARERQYARSVRSTAQRASI